MNQNNSQIDWNKRFSTQAEWTKPLRHFLSDQLGINQNSKVLEIGSGTGTILREMSDYSSCTTIGIDFDISRLKVDKLIQPDQQIACVNAHNLPFPQNFFDFVICHYFLLWDKEPIKAMKESFDVLSPNGTFIAFAEPDYLGRIESPSEFQKLADLQTKSLIDQGINPKIGRLLPELFEKAGFSDIQFGISGFQNSTKNVPISWQSEWTILENDLTNFMDFKELSQYKSKDLEYRKNGTRVSWVPTFYAFGRKPAI